MRLANYSFAKKKKKTMSVLFVTNESFAAQAGIVRGVTRVVRERGNVQQQIQLFREKLEIFNQFWFLFERICEWIYIHETL